MRKRAKCGKRRVILSLSKDDTSAMRELGKGSVASVASIALKKGFVLQELGVDTLKASFPRSLPPKF